MNPRLFREIKNIYKTYFESKLATSLLAHPELFSSVHKISQAICNMLIKYERVALADLANNPSLKIDLYNQKYFGHLPPEIERSTPADQLKTIIKLLSDERTNLSHVIQLHSAFIYRIYPSIIKAMEEKDPAEAEKAKSRKEAINNQIEFKKEFDGPHRGRLVPKPGSEKITTDVGIVTNPVLDKRLQKESKDLPFYGMTHEPARGRFERDEKSSFFRDIDQKDIPFVAGASSHSSSYMQCTALCDLSKDELQEYALACFAFLTSGGNHSFHEVMVVAKKVGVTYEVDNYLKSIPLAMRNAPVFASLAAKFPEFLTDDISMETMGKTVMADRLMGMATDMMTTQDPVVLKLNKKVIASHMMGMAAEMMAPEENKDVKSTSNDGKEIAFSMMGMAVDLMIPKDHIVPDSRKMAMISHLMGMAGDLMTSGSSNEGMEDKMSSSLIATMSDAIPISQAVEQPKSSLLALTDKPKETTSGKSNQEKEIAPTSCWSKFFSCCCKKKTISLPSQLTTPLELRKMPKDARIEPSLMVHL